VAQLRKKEEGRRKKEEGRRKKEEGRRKKEEGRRKKEEGRRKKEEVINHKGTKAQRKKEEGSPSPYYPFPITHSPAPILTRKKKSFLGGLTKPGRYRL